MSKQLTIFLVAAFASLSPLAPSLRAQTITGHVVDSISATPVGTGFVVLLDDQGREVARALSAGDGSFSMRAPSPGLYSVRSERIGYQAFTSETFELAAGQTLDLELRVTAQAIVLAAVEVQGEDRCRTNPEEAEETGLVWQEIRKALAATTWDGTQELARYRTYGYRRSWDLGREEILSEAGAIAEGFASQPYTSISVESLMEEGFVVESDDSISYNLPDARVLQHEAFLSAYCFHVVRDSLDRPGEVGLAFEPMSEFGDSDVRGTLWLDEASSELRRLEVSFMRLPYGLVEDRAGGTIEFMMLPSGAWIVHRWQVRAPRIRALTGGTREIGDRSQRIGIVGFNDTGGDVLEITVGDGERIYPPGLSHVQGTVYDNSKAAPLPGATIGIEGTEFWISTGAGGNYHLAVPLEGVYSATLSHPWLDSIGTAPLRTQVFLTADEVDAANFLVPHADSVARRACGYQSADALVGTVVGNVRSGGSGRPASGRLVSAHWQALDSSGTRTVPVSVEQSTRTDDTGDYVLCGMPLGVPLTIGVEGARPANIVFPREVGGNLLYARAREPTDTYTRGFRTSHRTWKVDLLLTGRRASTPVHEDRCALSGYVTDSSTDSPLSGVTLSLNDVDSTVTRDDGTFDLVGVRLDRGNNVVAAYRNGFEIWSREIWLEAGTTCLELSIELEPHQRPL